MITFKDKINRKPNPIIKANILSKWFFCWIHETFRKGRSNQLGPDDLYENIPSLDSKKLSLELIKFWEEEVRRKKPSVLRMIIKAYGWKFFPICIFYTILEISTHSLQPLFLGMVVSFFSESQASVTSSRLAYLSAAGLVLCSLVTSLCFHPFMFYMFEMGVRVRLACTGLVYRKCLRSSIQADNSGIAGFVIAMFATDLAQFDLAFYFLHELWKGPLEALVFGYIMYRRVGWQATMGIAAIVVLIPLQAWAAKAAAHYRHKSANLGDERVVLMNEIIGAIQLIKMYAWEKSFAKLIGKIRKKEIKATRGSMNINATIQCTNLISKLALFISLVVYVFTGDIVDAQKVFIISSFYDALKDSLLHYWPLAITTWAETVVCAQRIGQFLLESEDPADGGLENFGMEHDESTGCFHGRVHNPKAIRKSVILQNLSVSWDKADYAAEAAGKPRRHHVDNVSCEIHDHQFVGIVGDVGAGKSTLLNAILGELDIMQGNVEVNGVISYASQEAWVFGGSIRDNIVFVESYEERRYKAVLQACQLEHDLQRMPFGDSTIVGERGISLSGGQKARISLARAVYKRADIYLFDDPLAAVDTHVGKLLLERCFMRLLAGKIRILVTHHVQHLKHCDNLLLLEGGNVRAQGSYGELESMIHSRKHADEQEVLAAVRMLRANSIIDDGLDSEMVFDGDNKPLEIQDKGKDREEQQMQGSVKFHTYMSYFSAFKQPWLLMIIGVIFVAARGCQGVMEVFISKWATWEESLQPGEGIKDEYAAERDQIVITYAILIFSTFVLYALRTFGFYMACLRISVRLHDSLFRGVTRAYMFFFQTNPSGRIANRFSGDISDIDVALPQAMLDSFGFFIDAIAVLVIVALANFWLLVPALLMFVLLYLIRRLYIGASRSLKRMDAITRSPIYSHTNQTFHGLTTIRALNATHQMERTFHNHQNHNTSALFLFTSCNRAFAFWTDLICVLYTFIVTFSFLILNRDFYSGDVGLAITQSMTLIIMCQWGLRQTAELENDMTSVERVLEYAEMPSEPPLETDPAMDLSAEWPEYGCIEFRDVRMRYMETGDYVLKGLNFSIRRKEKIGIVGRTGAGKSSIIQAIFRLAYNEGLVKIDGYDISTLGLHDLRSRISIIPQDPILFSGSLRYNLDPFDEKTDEALWQALDEVKLKAYVSSLKGGLSCKMQEGGVNFSMGQRQLMCMARAILRHNRILIMDEATANVDAETDKLIQEAIRTRFVDCTVITIAHRLHTVMDSDRVLVMDAGMIVEMGHPHELLKNRQGYLHELVEKAGRATAKYLRLLAEKSYRKRYQKEFL